MKAKKPGLTREAIKQFNEERKGLEVNIMEEVLSSRRNAWRVAGAACVVSIACLSLAGFVVHRYSEPLPPYLLTYNDATHNLSTVAMTRNMASAGDDLDSKFLTEYVIHRETYDYNSVQADYEAVGLMSTSDAAQSYLSKFSGRNGMDKRLGDSESTKVGISSVILDHKHGVATIRFTTTRRVRSSPVDDPTQHWIVIIGYEYQELALNAAQRSINPLGFRVTSYRVYPETK